MYLLPVLCSFTCILQVLCTPTVSPCKTFNATKDARTTCDIGRLEDTVSKEKIIRMLCHRTIDERIKVKEEFEKIKDDKYCSKKDIAPYICPSDPMQFGVSDYKNLIEEAFKTEEKIYLDDLANLFSTNNSWIDVETIIEILLSIPPEGKFEFRLHYDKAGYSKSFDDGLNNLGGDLAHIVRELSMRERQKEKPVDQKQAQKDADLLFAGRKSWGDHRNNLDRILMETSIKQLNATLFEFKKRHDKPLEQLIDEKMNTDTRKRDAYKELIHYANNPANYYARRLENYFNAGFKYTQNVNRIILIHSGTDLVEIAAAYQANTQRLLIHDIEWQTDSDREKLLCCLAGKGGFEET